MATFKVGQRVKNITDDSPIGGHDEDSTTFIPIGAEGTINEGPVIVDGYVAYGVNFDCDPDLAGVWCAYFELAPLTDPGFDAFMERVMQPIKEPVSA